MTSPGLPQTGTTAAPRRDTPREGVARAKANIRLMGDEPPQLATQLKQMLAAHPLLSMGLAAAGGLALFRLPGLRRTIMPLALIAFRRFL